ncbi:hypothetical protein CI610_03340 [invertebrate metagenome]|uniref:Uncharacterized protein n=1 Tax=invertebrate metagenome TaxID=1711999 RepID=A0A2H9T3C6_9ZZZZ
MPNWENLSANCKLHPNTHIEFSMLTNFTVHSVFLKTKLGIFSLIVKSRHTNVIWNFRVDFGKKSG